MSKFDLRGFLSEMTQAQSPADKEFTALHTVQKKGAPDATEAQFKATHPVKKDESKLAHPSNATGMVDDVAKTTPLGEQGPSFEDGVEANLQELSKRTLHSYAAKAKGSAQAARATAKFARQRDEYDRADAAVAKASKRAKGSKKALEKLREQYELDESMNEESFQTAIDAIVEQEELISELSKETLKSYTKKATTSKDRAWTKSDREEDKAMSTDGNKYPDKQARHQAAANKAIGIWNKRRKGLDAAGEKLAKK